VVLRAFPVTYASDVEAVAAFWELLDFHRQVQLPPDGEPGYVGLARDGAELAVTHVQWAAGRYGMSRGSGPRFEMYVYVDDLEATLSRLIGAEVPVLRCAEDMPWGERIATVADPEETPSRSARRTRRPTRRITACATSRYEDARVSPAGATFSQASAGTLDQRGMWRARWANRGDLNGRPRTGRFWTPTRNGTDHLMYASDPLSTADSTSATRNSVPPAGLTIKRSAGPDSVRITVAGELDVATVAELDRELDRINAAETPRLVIDLGGVTFMDSTGLHAVVQRHRHAEANGYELVLGRGSDQVERLFELTGVDQILSFEDEPAAREHGRTPDSEGA
jgi:lactoylglutathione lyase